MIDTWVVVADGGSARIFSSPADLSKLSLVLERKNGHHAVDADGQRDRRSDDGRQKEEVAFAEDLGREIVAVVGSHEVRDVVLVAPAPFLSDLVTSLPASIAARVRGKVGKDYTKVKVHDLANRLKQALGPAPRPH